MHLETKLEENQQTAKEKEKQVIKRSVILIIGKCLDQFKISHDIEYTQDRIEHPPDKNQNHPDPREVAPKDVTFQLLNKLKDSEMEDQSIITQDDRK
jgi:hypothetical protein